MKCNLCLSNEATKKNTHYFTDAIIREALNERGKKSRGFGAFWELSTNQLGSAFGFQQETTIKTLQETLGREANEIEISKAKENPYTYDDVFCVKYEKHFGTIEDHYLTKVLPKIKKASENGLVYINI